MLGRNHLISNIASVTILYTGLSTVAAHSDGFIGAVTAPCAQSVLDSFTVYGDLPKTAVVALGAVLFFIGTYLPDIDNPNSRFGKVFHLPVEHRTWTHAIWFPAVMALLSIVFPPLLWLVLGYVLHLFWDSLSRGGVCWFYPISRYNKYGSGAQVKRKHPVKIYAVGEMSEYILVGVIVAIALICLGLYLGVPFPKPVVL